MDGEHVEVRPEDFQFDKYITMRKPPDPTIARYASSMMSWQTINPRLLREEQSMYRRERIRSSDGHMNYDFVFFVERSLRTDQAIGMMLMNYWPPKRINNMCRREMDDHFREEMDKIFNAKNQ